MGNGRPTCADRPRRHHGPSRRSPRLRHLRESHSLSTSVLGWDATKSRLAIQMVIVGSHDNTVASAVSSLRHLKQAATMLAPQGDGGDSGNREENSARSRSQSSRSRLQLPVGVFEDR
jgi:hypothetical protein